MSEQIFTIELVFVIVLATALDVAEVVVEDQQWIGSRHQHVDPHGELAVLQEQRVPDQLKPRIAQRLLDHFGGDTGDIYGVKAHQGG